MTLIFCLIVIASCFIDWDKVMKNLTEAMNDEERNNL